MNINKCNALKILGFKYITRDMKCSLVAWKHLPIRSLTVLSGYEEEAKTKFPDAIIYDVEDTKQDDSYTYVNGYNVDFCWFSRSEDDNAVDSIMHLDKDDTDYQEVTWENSPYIL